MSNYTNENLINVPSSNVPAGTLAMKVGDDIFTAGYIVISSGGSSGPAPAEHVSSGAVIYEYDPAAVSSGWDYQAALINNGGSMVVSSGGTGTDTAILWNGSLTVSSGGTVRNTKVISGTLVVSDGGTASDTFLLAGSMAVSNGGTATNTRVLGGNAYFSGGIADGAQIENGGYMRLSSGVSGSNILIHSGGRLDIYNPGTGAVVTSVTVSGIFDIWGGASADHVHVCSGGLMYQREGAIVTNLVVDEGGEVQ